MILQRKWYALHTRSRFENVVNEGLIRKSIEAFLPKVPVRSKRQDRKKIISVPLFPGYIFVKTNLDPREHLEIVKTFGVVRLVGTTNNPIFVPDETIDSLKIMVSADLPIELGTMFKAGKRIIIVNGPFTGVSGYFMRYKGKGRAVVNIRAIGQFAAVEVDEQDIEPLPTNTTITD